MDEQDRRALEQNKHIRGYIIRSLVKGYQNSLLVAQLTHVMTTNGVVVSPDISKHLDYLLDEGYITFTDKKITAVNAYREDAMIRLTAKGQKLVEGIIEDPGVVV